MSLRNGSVAARDGAEIAYTLRTADRPDAPRIALIHSLALDRSVWDFVVERLDGQADLLTYDARGHGASTRSAGPYTADVFADDLADLLRGIGWERAIVGGASMGGSVSLQFAGRYPRMLQGLGLFDTTAWYGEDAPKSWGERAQKAQTDGLDSMVAFQLTRWFGDAFRAAHPEVGEHYGRIFRENDVAAYAATCNMLGAFDARASLGSIAVPVEILVGEEDYATPPAMSEALARAIPGAHFRVLPQARHLSPIEQPDAIADALRAVMARSREAAIADAR